MVITSAHNVKHTSLMEAAMFKLAQDDLRSVLRILAIELISDLKSGMPQNFWK